MLGLGGKGNDSKALEFGGVNADKGSFGRSFGNLRRREGAAEAMNYLSQR